MSRIESYVGMFRPDHADGAVVDRVEIPLIQRDYAQGRVGGKVDDIRRDFLDVLHAALRDEHAEPVSLDFVYGEIDGGVLRPLDGQQRLTTLFLLHWYLAARAGQLDADARWTRFSYATRPSAHRFCTRLSSAVPPPEAAPLSEWIRDQAWYLFVWRNDPTIEAMLVMLDAIDARFGDIDPVLAWRRLTDPDAPAVSFHLLPLPDMGSAEDLYIKMNSRGKPLTDFENFKAQFERIIESSPRAEEFALRIDGPWSDLLWGLRGDDDLVDDEFLAYLEFVVEICEWIDPELTSGAGRLRLAERSALVFGAGNPRRDDHLDFLFAAFDVWSEHDPASTFAALYRSNRSEDDARVRLFFRDSSTNLFESCCRFYGATRGMTRQFTFGQTLVLYATLLHLIHGTEDFPARVRVLRNLIEGSQFEVRADRMSRLVADTRGLIVDGLLPEAGSGFSYPQLDDEKAKRDFLAEQPDARPPLERFEDHELLRGTLSAFDLDPAVLDRRRAAFELLMDQPRLWWEATAALLALGDYQRPRGREPHNSRSFQFATWDPAHADVWRSLLVGADRQALAATRSVLGALLDLLADASADPEAAMRELCDAWLREREESDRFDWRYYMVKYRSMREGASGIYFADGKRMGYSLCNLRGGMEQMNSKYRDPYLLAIWDELDRPEGVVDPWFLGYEWLERYLTLSGSGVGIRCVPAGFHLVGPGVDDEALRRTFDALRAEEGIGDDLLVTIPQSPDDEGGVDTVDRVQVGARLLTRMLEAGL